MGGKVYTLVNDATGSHIYLSQNASVVPYNYVTSEGERRAAAARSVLKMTETTTGTIFAFYGRHLGATQQQQDALIDIGAGVDAAALAYGAAKGGGMPPFSATRPQFEPLSLRLEGLSPTTYRYAAETTADVAAIPKGSANPVTRAAARRGSTLHSDKPGMLPDQLRAQYPNTTFEFTKPGVAWQDVKVVGGNHPSTYGTSSWPKDVNYGDFKPGTDGGAKTFKYDQKYKWDDPTHYLPYDPVTGKLKPH